MDNTQLSWLGDELPMIYDASIHIFFLSPSPKSTKRNESIHMYALSLHDLWVRGFGTDLVVHLNSVKNMRMKVMSDYDKLSLGYFGKRTVKYEECAKVPYIYIPYIWYFIPYIW